MKRKTLNGRTVNGKSKRKKGSLVRHLTAEIGQLPFMSFQQQPNPCRFSNNLADSAAQSHFITSASLEFETGGNSDEKDFILSQDFFCTPDYITPEAPAIANSLDCNAENTPCPRSPEKIKTVGSKRQRPDGISATYLGCNFSDQLQITGPAKEFSGAEKMKAEQKVESQKSHSYVSQSAVALRCRVMPPPCIKNPYLRDASDIDIDPFGTRRSKCAGFYSAFSDSDGLSRYRTDFHEIEQIGNGNFSHVFKVLKRIDGCMYAVKQSTRQLRQDTERRKALMEVQALAALGNHENVVGYYSSWFENEQLYIQMELCDHSLSINRSSKPFTEREALEAMYQTARALQFIHERGIAHLDVKPDNIYVKNGVYKLGDFGCATLRDRSLPIEEGDARYMPQEILNENYDHLDKVDIFSLGAAIYELVRGSALPESGPHFLSLRDGKLPLLPGHSLQFQNLLKVMMDPDPIQRPSAKELVDNPIFGRSQRNSKSK